MQAWISFQMSDTEILSRILSNSNSHICLL